MAHGYASDIEGDDTVMDSPHVTISIDLTNLPPAQALQLAQASGIEHFDAYSIGELMQGDGPDGSMTDAEFHIPLGEGLTVLQQMGVLEMPEQPPQDPEEVVEDEGSEQ